MMAAHAWQGEGEGEGEEGAVLRLFVTLCPSRFCCLPCPFPSPTGSFSLFLALYLSITHEGRKPPPPNCDVEKSVPASMAMVAGGGCEEVECVSREKKVFGRRKELCEVELKKDDERRRKISLSLFWLYLAEKSPARPPQHAHQSTSRLFLVPATMRPHALPRSRVLLLGPARTSTRRRHPSSSCKDNGPSASSKTSSPASTSSSSLSASASPGSVDPAESERHHQYTYVDAAGKRKATLQDAAPSLLTSSSSSSSSSAADEAQRPWELGFQMPERSSALWGDDLRRRLIRHALAAKFGGGGDPSSNDAEEASGLVLSEAEIDERLAQLARLLPGLAPRLATTSASLLAEMVADPAAVAATLVGLRATFPGADIGRMVSRSPQLALAGGGGGGGGRVGGASMGGSGGGGGGGLAALAEARAALAELLPNLDVDAAVSEHPSLLDVRGVASAIDEARRVLGPSKFDLAAFEREPSLVFRFQHGDLLIPYDQFEKGS